MLIVGLTGGIGSGKTTVANLFADLGVPVIDTDLLAREVTDIGAPALHEISKHFGKTILNPDGSLNRAKLRDLIFANDSERLWLQNILHPLILNRAQSRLTELHAPYAIVVIPLLLESNPIHFINRILVVDASEENQVQRTMSRDKSSQSAVKAILNTQINRQSRLTQAHDIIQNDGSLDHLKQQVEKLHRVYSETSQAS
jgi:dephospho-CoA kinase